MKQEILTRLYKIRHEVDETPNKEFAGRIEFIKKVSAAIDFLLNYKTTKDVE